MIESNIFINNMQKLLAAYSHKNFKLTEDSMNIWYEFFKNYDTIDFERGIIMYIRQNQYSPTISQLTECINFAKDYRVRKEEFKKFVPPEKRKIVYYDKD